MLSFKEIYQSYLKLSGPEIRLRYTLEVDVTCKAIKNAFLTIKSGNGIKRSEWEFKIPNWLYWPLTMFKKRHLEKDRYIYVDGPGQRWGIDYYPSGLMVAEIELDSEAQEVVKPYWLGEEVTNDPKYKNVNLAS